MLGVESNQYALFLNGAPVVGTVYGSGAGTQQDNGQAIIAIAAGDVLPFEITLLMQPWTVLSIYLFPSHEAHLQLSADSPELLH